MRSAADPIDRPHVVHLRQFIAANFDGIMGHGITRWQLLDSLYGVTPVSPAANFKRTNKLLDDARTTVNRAFESRFDGLLIINAIVNGTHGKERRKIYGRLRDSLGRRDGITHIVPTRGRNSIYVIPSAGEALREMGEKLGVQVVTMRRTLTSAKNIHYQLPTGRFGRDALDGYDRYLKQYILPPGTDPPDGKRDGKRKR